MKSITQKSKKELDKLISIARNYRSGTLSESMFHDVVKSLNADKDLISTFKDYISDAGIKLISDSADIDDIDEQIDTSAKIQPYDTTNIDISPKHFSLQNILDRLANEEEIDLLPDFQRIPGLWSVEQKSQLIESLILRIPLPAFYFDGSNNDRWIVIDGLQRLTALKEFFIDKTLVLSGLEFLHDLEGAKLEDMPRAYERRMRETQVTAYIINPGAPTNLKYNIFKRINTGGITLEPQEIRHALYQGYATVYIKELADLVLFKKSIGYSVNSERMMDREFVLRFIAFYEQDLSLYNGSIEVFLNNTMEIINKKYDPNVTPLYAEEVKETFKSVLDVNIKIFGKFAFRRMPDMEKRRPINKALFETWTICLTKHSISERHELLSKKDILLSKYVSMCKDDKEFIESIRSAKISSVKKRFEKIQELLVEVLRND